MQAHRGPGWSTAESPSRPSLSRPPAGPPSFLTPPLPSSSLTHPPAPSGGRTPGRHSGSAALVEPRAGRLAHRTGASAGRTAPGDARARARGRLARGRAPRGRAPPPPSRAPRGERAPRAGAHTRDRALLSRSLSRPSSLGIQTAFRHHQPRIFSPLSLVAVRPSVPAGGGGGGRKAERGKSISLSLLIRPRILL